jgi:hypothetical protein
VAAASGGGESAPESLPDTGGMSLLTPLLLPGAALLLALGLVTRRLLR